MAVAAKAPTEVDQLEDFEAYLEPDFDQHKLANGILCATNGVENPELDLNTPLKKLKYDLVEIEKRIKQTTSQNHEVLIQKFTEVSTYKQILQDRIEPQMQLVNKPFSKIQREVIEPYERATQLNNAVYRMHQTLQLLRHVSFFIFIIQQLEELQMNYTDRDVIKIARLMNQLSRLYLELGPDADLKATPVMQIRLVRDYQTTLNTRRSIMLSECAQLVSSELAKTTSLSSKNTKLYNNLQALYILNQLEFYSVVEKCTVTRQLSVGTSQLSKALQSPRNFTSLLLDVQESASTYFDKLNHVLGQWKIHVERDGNSSPNGNSNGNGHENSDGNGNGGVVSILKLMLQHFKCDSLETLLWSKLALSFKRNIAATMARGGPTAKNLKVYNQGLKNAVHEKLTNELERDLILDALTMIDYK
ncbi:uncharacterized protein LODBEIA_P07500 [Lodderomyces beijingensis]|uniref:Conserved oligomeric Golgi complex subunit 5 n=1 Tax=Lodderomyces beijingensis TaxID=1775926 RepID=A0ABP0ZI92_9ASCO